MRCFAEFLKGYVIDKGMVQLWPKKLRTAKPLAKIALEIFRRNFGTKLPKLQIVQNLLHMLDYCIIIHNIQVNN